MRDRFEGANALTLISSLSASGSQDCGLVNCRGLSSIAITGRATYNGSATGSLAITALYSPDGKAFDTLALSTLTLTASAGNIVQKSAIVAVPDTGWLKLIITNADATYAATSVIVWASVIAQFITDRQLPAST